MRLTRFTGPRNRLEKGSLTVELTLAAPLFLLLLII